MNHLFINTLGMINALGNNNSQILDNLRLSAQTNIIKDAHFSLNKNTYIAQINANLPKINKNNLYFNSRNNQILLQALQQIETAVKQLKNTLGAEKIAVIMGSSTSGIFETENALLYFKTHGKYPKDYDYRQQEMGSSAAFVKDYFALKNLSITISTACSSSAKVFSTARDLIQSGYCDAAIVGGVDSLCRMTINGFASLEAVATHICNPFSLNRNGITIGEGAAVFIVSEQPAKIRISGIGESSDAYHMSAPDPKGEGAERAIRAALNEANLRPENIDYINLHGTATAKNDAMEATVINRIFGEKVKCSSTKPMTGHTLGAAGATEIGLCTLLLLQGKKNNWLPAHLWDSEIDPELPKINLVVKNNLSKTRTYTKIMSNSFAFGGSNASVILENEI